MNAPTVKIVSRPANIETLRSVSGVCQCDACTAMRWAVGEIDRMGAMAGLEERLARLLVSDESGERFVLSDRSAANIAAIAREWVKPNNQQSTQPEK